METIERVQKHKVQRRRGRPRFVARCCSAARRCALNEGASSRRPCRPNGRGCAPEHTLSSSRPERDSSWHAHAQGVLGLLVVGDGGQVFKSTFDVGLARRGWHERQHGVMHGGVQHSQAGVQQPVNRVWRDPCMRACGLAQSACTWPIRCMSPCARCLPRGPAGGADRRLRGHDPGAHLAGALHGARAGPPQRP